MHSLRPEYLHATVIAAMPCRNVEKYLLQFSHAYRGDTQDTHPLSAVLFFMTSIGVVGSGGTNASYMKKSRMSTMPTMSVAKT